MAFAERRLLDQKAPGVLLTNGTGTGKTFSGMGTVKRALDRGAKHVLVVAPSDKVGSDWVHTAKKFFDVRDIVQLGEGNERSTKDTGGKNRVVVMTYATLGQNANLVQRPWDMLVADEAHYLSQAKDGNTTLAQEAFKALSQHPAGAYRRAEMLEPEAAATVAKGRKNNETAYDAATQKIRAKRDDLMKAQPARDQRPKAVFLSATPFAYHFSLDYAEGYLFDYPEENQRTVGRYNHPSPRSQFYVDNFGYRMRNGKLTQPEAGVATGILERRFAEKLMKDGAMSGRKLKSDKDYSRDFVVTESPLGQKIDEVMSAIAENPDLRPLSKYLGVSDYLTRRYLLEALKARDAVARIKQHLAMGRKVVVFHDYKKGGSTEFGNPLRLSAGNHPDEAQYQGAGKPYKMVNIAKAYEQLAQQVPGFRGAVAALDHLSTPIEELRRAFPGALVFNGDVPKSQRRAAVANFMDSGSKADVIVVQRASGKEGISLHDMDGQHQRVLVELGIPSRPTDAIQTEGRIIRFGMKSNAILEYLSTGTDFERWTFAQTIAQRSSTAENLAMGEQARGLLQSFATGYNDAAPMEPHAGQGTGGKAMDRTAATTDPYDAAVALYYTNAKKTQRTKAAEGVDYFATPEPLGLKMVEWAGIRPGEKVLEPSAGHGAIARFFPDATNRHAVEPSHELAGRLALNATDIDIHEMPFEQFNVVNKFNTVVMNPPFGTAGRTAVDHIAKAAQHLRERGRIVAVLPEGSAVEKFEKWLRSDDAKGIYLTATVKLPAVTFERAGTAVRTRVVVLDKLPKGSEAPEPVTREVAGDTVKDFFANLRNVVVPERPAAVASDTARAPEPEPGEEPAPVPRPTAASPNTFAPADFSHTRGGQQVYVAKITRKLSSLEYAAMKDLARTNGGHYSSYRGEGAIPGFHFKTAVERDAFLGRADDANNTANAAPPAEIAELVQREENTLDAARPGPTIDRHIDKPIKRILQGGRFMWEGTADVLDRSGFPELAKAMWHQQDEQARIAGKEWAPFARILTKLRGPAAAQAKADWRDYFQNKESGRLAQAAALYARTTPAARALIDAWRNLADESGHELQAEGVQVKDGNRWRPIGHLGRDFFPRKTNDAVREAMVNRRKDPATWNKYVQDLIRNGNISTAAEADQYVNENVFRRETSSGSFANIERARGAKKLPESWLEYDFNKIAPWYISKYAQRMAQIRAYGQKTDTQKDLWDRVLESLPPGDPYTDEYIKAARDASDFTRQRGTVDRVLGNLQAIATGGFLSNPMSAIRNIVSGTTQTAVAFGPTSALSNTFKAMMSARDRLDARERGVIKDDLLAELMHEGRTENLNAKIHKVAGAGLKYTGFNLMEDYVRTAGVLSAKTAVRGAVEAMRKNMGSAKSLQFMALLRRMRVDPLVVANEGPDGPEAKKFIRNAVVETQGGYSFAQTPLHLTHPTMAFVFQFTKWGTQMMRFVIKHAINPAIFGTEVQVPRSAKFPNGTARARTWKPLLYVLGGALFGGELLYWLKEMFTGRKRSDATFEEITNVANEGKTGQAVGLLVSRAVSDIIMAGTLGILSDYGSGLKDFVTRGRSKNPFDPPGVQVAKSLLDGAREVWQQWKNTGLTFEKWVEHNLGVIGSVAGDKALKQFPGITFGSKLTKQITGDREQDARNVVAMTRDAGMRMAKELGLPIAAQFGGDSPSKSESTPFYDTLKTSLLTGDTGTARGAIRERLQGKTALEQRNIMSGIKSSVDSGQPIKVGGMASALNRELFFNWARKRLPGGDLQRIKELDSRYWRTATALGLADGPPVPSQKKLDEAAPVLTGFRRR